MDILSIIESLKEFGFGNLTVIVIIFLSLVQIVPIKINPWTKFFGWIGQTINKDVLAELKIVKEDLSGVHKELDSMKEAEEVREANAARNRILRFDDELRRKIEHSEEFWSQTLDDVTFYRNYCDSNDKYPNSKADVAMKNIEETYHEVKKENRFI